MERIKRDDNRVDIAKLKEEDISGDDLTGGYIFRLDKGEDDGWQSEFDFFGSDGRFPFYHFYYPDEADIQEVQAEYISSYMHDFEEAAVSDDFRNRQGRHYTEYINLRSFVDHFILSELSKNVDAYRLSSYFHKRKDSNGGRVHLGPVWDYNLSFGNADFCNTQDVEEWLYYGCVGNSPSWWDNFLQNDNTFRDALGCRYSELRSSFMRTDNMLRTIESWVTELDEAKDRNYEQWDILGTYIWPNADFFSWAVTYEVLIDNYKNWIANRLVWLDENMPSSGIDCEQYDDPEFEVSPITSTSEDYNSNVLTIFPNPTNGSVFINSKESIEQIIILDMTGRVSYSAEDITNGNRLDLDLSKGQYIVQCKTSDSVISKRLVIN